MTFYIWLMFLGFNIVITTVTLNLLIFGGDRGRSMFSSKRKHIRNFTSELILFMMSSWLLLIAFIGTVNTKVAQIKSLYSVKYFVQ